MTTDTIHNEPPPPVQDGQSGPRCDGIFIKLQVPGLFSAGPGENVLADMLGKIISRALREKSLLCHDQPCEANAFSLKESFIVGARIDIMVGLFEVTDLDAGALAIRAELESFAALQYSEIGWFDTDDGWIGWYPPDAKNPFEDPRALLKRLRDIRRRQEPPPQTPPPPPQGPSPQ